MIEKLQMLGEVGIHVRNLDLLSLEGSHATETKTESACGVALHRVNTYC